MAIGGCRLKTTPMQIQARQHIKIHVSCVKIEISFKYLLAHGLFEFSTDIFSTVNQAHELFNGENEK